MTILNRRAVRTSIIGVALSCVCLAPTDAATITWDGDLNDRWIGASFNGFFWNTNWDNDGGPSPNLPTAPDTVVFTGNTPNTTIGLSVNVGVNDIVFGGTFDYTLGTVVGGQTIVLTSGDITTNGFANTLTINSNIDIGAAGTWHIGSTVAMVMNGEVQGDNLTKTGTGVLSFSNNNTQASTRVEAGTLAITAVNQLGVSNALTTLAGGELRFDGPLNAGASRPIALESNGSSINTNGQNVEWSSILSGTGGFTKTGAGTLTLDAANTYTGTTTISDGTLRIGNGGAGGEIVGDVVNNSALIFNKSVPLNYAGVISGSGTVTKDGIGALTLSGNNTYSGGTTVNNGLLLLANNNAAGTGTITANGGIIQYNNGVDIANTLDLQADTDLFVGTGSATHAGVIQGGFGIDKVSVASLTLAGANTYTGGTTISAGELIVSSDNNLGASNGDLTLDGGTLTLGASFDLSNARTLTLGSSGGTINTNNFDTTISQAISGTGDLTKNGGGTLTLGGDVFSVGSVDVRQGTLLVNAAGSVQPPLNATGLTVGTFGNPAELQIQGGVYAGHFGTSTIGPNGTVTVTSGGQFEPGADLDIDGGAFTLDSSSSFSLDNGRTLSATNDAQVDFAGNYSIDFGTHFDLQSGSDLVVGNYLDMVEGTLTVDGAGTTVNTNTTGSTVSEWGYNDANTVTVRNQAAYTINSGANLFLGDSGPGNATLNIESDADFNANTLTVATIPFGTATINLTGTGSTLTQSGASTLTVGSSDPGATGTGTINVTDNATFDAGTGVIDVFATGALNVNTGGIFDATPPNAAAKAAGTPGVTVTTSGVWAIADGEVRLNGGRGGNGDLTNKGGVGGVGGVLNMNDGSIDLTGTAQLILTGGRGGNNEPFIPLNPGAGGVGGQANLAGGALTLSGTSSLNLNGGVTGTAPNSSGGPTSGRGGTMNVSGAAVVINAGATASLNGGRGGSTRPGTFHAGNGGHGGELNLAGGSVDINGGTLSLFGGNGRSDTSTIVNGGDGGDGGTLTVSSGVLTVNSGLISTAGGSRGTGGSFANNSIDGAHGLIDITGGTFEINGGEVFTGTLNHPGTGAFNFLGGTLTVDAFNGDLTQDGGTLAPGMSPGTTAITGNYVMNAGTLAIELGGLTPGSGHDQVTVTNDVTIAGGLDIALTNGFTPSPGMTMELVTFGGNLTGAFSFVMNSTALAGLNLIVTSDADSIDISFDALVGDLNLDGFVGIADLNIVLGAWNQNVDAGVWGQGDPSGDGFIGIDDLNTVLGNWNAGTPPPPIGQTSIPEPGTAVVILGGACLLGHTRRRG